MCSDPHIGSDACRGCKFQSLGRDSVCSDDIPAFCIALSSAVSIPRSGFCVFRLDLVRCPSGNVVVVSIPRSGFCVFRPDRGSRSGGSLSCFNPSVGILCVQTFLPVLVGNGPDQFQSLGRDSVCSDDTTRRVIGFPDKVSIPRSGFCVFRLCLEWGNPRQHK